MIQPGLPEPWGAQARDGGVNFAVHSTTAEAIEVCLYDGDTEAARHTLPARTGPVFHGFIPGAGPGTRYGLRAHGPWAPNHGHRFNPAKLLADPFALALDRPFTLHPSQFSGTDQHNTDSAPLMPKAVVPDPAAPLPPPVQPLVPWPRTIIYEAHIRGLTMRHPDIPEAQRGTFAALGHPAVVAYLKNLGVTTLEIMPAAAWIDERHLGPLGLRNYWGYNPVTQMAPDPRLAPGGWAEIRAATDALAEAGIETILDVVLNHSGEGDELGPTLSQRGLDNAGAYHLRADNPALYANDTGCGNMLAMHRPAQVRLAMDALRAWSRRGGIRGFRFDLATTLARRADGFDPQAPLLAALDQDPELRGLKLIAEPWDIGPGGYQLGHFPAGWGEWNDRFRDDVRRFWRGDGNMAGELATRLAGSADSFSNGGRPSRSVNFVVAHDGFTLADLVSFQSKHNQANGEDNRDGTSDNHSWNHGAEGETSDPAIIAARAADQRALLATLLLARGTPMLCTGAERGHSQGGNNNAYAQDNAISWLDWSAPDLGLPDFTAALAHLRATHPALRQDRFLTGQPDANGIPDVQWLRPDGAPMADADWAGADTLGMLLAATDAPDRALIWLHRAASPLNAALPPGTAWTVALATQLPAPVIENGFVALPGRGVTLLVTPAP